MIFDYTSNDLCCMSLSHRSAINGYDLSITLQYKKNPNLYPNVPIRLSPFFHIWFSFDTCSQITFTSNYKEIKFISQLIRRNFTFCSNLMMSRFSKHVFFLYSSGRVNGVLSSDPIWTTQLKIDALVTRSQNEMQNWTKLCFQCTWEKLIF